MRIIAGRWRGRTIRTPPGHRTRPTTDRVREAWLSALQHDVPGATVLDLFAGSGALGLEALSRGAAHVTFVETGGAPLRALEANIHTLEAGALTTVVKADALRYVDGLAEAAFDLALADPPYEGGAADRLVAAFERVPFARILCIEHSARTDLPAGPGARTRRYGETALTFITATP
ncbi:MAG TPA: 16S rRNA (guanine(966)-N(2))-methyltransferase RsmD [Longimicrobiales bacterium]|nr:16S rRNA (guanine(966)-N(2))-methyltransferase RsmD [Longimicrobiales bacterium]